MADALVPANKLPVALAGMAARANALVRQPAVQRSLPALGLLGIVGAAALAWSTIAAAPQRPLFPGMADADTAAVAEGLKTAGLAYSVDRATGALTVSSDDYYRARMLLAAQGLPKSAPEGGAMLEGLPMGASHAVETETLRDARERDLARTIEAIDTVEQARVHIADDRSSSFLRDAAAPSASVMLTLRGGQSLSAAQANGIVRLISASVPGLAADRVSVVDQRGTLLSNDSVDPAAGQAARQIDQQARVESRYRQAIATLLGPVLGRDGYTAEVHADLDFAENQSTREQYPEDSRAIAREESRWTSAAGEASAVGIPGALSNTPPPATQLALTPPAASSPPAIAPGRTSEDSTRSFALGREVSVTRNAVGTVRRLSVAVALDNPSGAKPRTKAEIAQIEALIKGAVGFDARRGDLVAVSARTFVADAATVSAWYRGDWVMQLGRILAALAAIAILAFGIGRPFLAFRAKQADARRAELAPLIEGELARHVTHDDVTLEMISAAPSYAARAEMVREFVAQDPKRAAAVVRTLLADAA